MAKSTGGNYPNATAIVDCIKFGLSSSKQVRTAVIFLSIGGALLRATPSNAGAVCCVFIRTATFHFSRFSSSSVHIAAELSDSCDDATTGVYGGGGCLALLGVGGISRACIRQ